MPFDAGVFDRVLKSRADADADGRLTAREMRISLVSIIRGIASRNSGHDFDASGTVDRGDLRAAIASFRRLLGAACGNGVTEAGEECDDGDAQDGDGCSGTCRVEDGYACEGEPSRCIEHNVISVVDSDGNVGDHVAAALGTDGLPLLAYADSTYGGINVAKCGDHRCSAGNTITTIGHDGLAVRDIAIVVPPDGLPAIAYRVGTGSYNYRVELLRCGNDACTDGNTVHPIADLSYIWLQDQGRQILVAIDQADHPVITYRDDPNEALRLARCGDAVCSSVGVDVLLDGDIASGGTKRVTMIGSLVVGTDNRPVVLYVLEDSWTRETWLRAVRCGNALCSAGNLISTVAVGAVDLARLPAGMVGGNGFPIGVFTDGFNVRTVACSNAACSSAIMRSMMAGSGLKPKALILGSNGVPTLVWQDGWKELNVILCSDVDCSSARTHATGIHAAGHGIAALLGPDGLPVIAYRDEQSGGLRVLHCGNAECRNQ